MVPEERSQSSRAAPVATGIDATGRLTVVGMYSWWTFWALGEGKGSPSFYLSPKGFVNAGHRMVIVMPRRDNPPGPGEYHGIELYRFRGGPPTIQENMSRGRFPRFFIRNFRYWQFQVASFIAGYRVCRRVKPDVIISYGDHPAPATWLLGKIFRAPTITRLFGTFLTRYLGSPVKMYYHYIQVLGFITPARYVICCDDGSGADAVARELRVPDARFRFWRNGSDHDLFDPDADPVALRRQLGVPVEGPVLFTISRMHREKHVERILDALPRVIARHPHCHFLMIGDGPETPALKAHCRSLGIESAVSWVGSVDRERLGRYINAGDVFVAMSDRTNAANPLFEAMLGARPAVVLNTGGTDRVISDGVNGWLVPGDRPQELGRILVDALADMSRVREAGRRALDWARENIPTLEERQRMEVALAEQAVREWRAERRR